MEPADTGEEVDESESPCGHQWSVVDGVAADALHSKGLAYAGSIELPVVNFIEALPWWEPRSITADPYCQSIAPNKPSAALLQTFRTAISQILPDTVVVLRMTRYVLPGDISQWHEYNHSLTSAS